MSLSASRSGTPPLRATKEASIGGFPSFSTLPIKDVAGAASRGIKKAVLTTRSALAASLYAAKAPLADVGIGDAIQGQHT